MSEQREQETQKLSRREFMRIAGLSTAGVAASSLLVSCGPEPTPSPEVGATAVATPVPAEKVEVVWWTESAPESIKENIHEVLVEPFNASHPNIELKLEFVAELAEKVRTAVAGGAGPDILETVGPTTSLEFYSAGQVVPLNDHADQFGWQDVMAPWAIAAGTTRDGEMFCTQLTQETMAMVYNKGLLDEKGWELPTGPNELAEVAEACMADGIAPYAAFGVGGANLYITTILNDYASALKNYEFLTGQTPFTAQVFVDALDYLNMMIEGGWLGDKYWDLQFGQEWPLLVEGEALMKMDGTWFFKSGAESLAQFEWDVAPLPNLREDIIHTWALGSGESLSISAGSENPDAAAEVLNYLYSDPARAGQLIAAHPGEWNLPITNLTQEHLPDSVDPRQAKVLLGMAEAAEAKEIGYLTWSSWPPKTQGVLLDNLESMLKGDMSGDELCSMIQEQFETEVEQGNVMNIPETKGV